MKYAPNFRASVTIEVTIESTAIFCVAVMAGNYEPILKRRG
jgi:hypothetical protein